MTSSDIREDVRARYAEAALRVTSTRELPLADAGCCGASPTEAGCCDAAATDADSCGTSATDAAFGSELYDQIERRDLPETAVLASLGCGNPTAVAELRAGETVLDLGSGGGIDVLLSAKRVGPTGMAYGLDMTDEMLELAGRNASIAGASNVEFLKGYIEDIPLPDASVDVVISNCVINLASDKTAVFSEMYRVLKPGGRIGVSDVVAEDSLDVEERARTGSYVGCIAGALSFEEYRRGLAHAGFVTIEIEPADTTGGDMLSSAGRELLAEAVALVRGEVLAPVSARH